MQVGSGCIFFFRDTTSDQDMISESGCGCGSGQKCVITLSFAMVSLRGWVFL